MSGAVWPALRRRLVRTVAVLAMATVAWTGGFLWFVAQVPRAVPDARTTTDAIVVLTGGSERLRVAFALLSSGLGRKLFVSGVPAGVETPAILRQAGQDDLPPPLEAKVVLGHAAEDTVGNARETTDWLRHEGFGSFRLVTADYHMPRSLLEFRRAAPDAAILPNPVFPDTVKTEAWWQWPGTTRLLIGEYHKYVLSLAAGWLERVTTGSPA